LLVTLTLRAAAAEDDVVGFVTKGDLRVGVNSLGENSAMAVSHWELLSSPHQHQHHQYSVPVEQPHEGRFHPFHYLLRCSGCLLLVLSCLS
jgi:hypothetical protein